LRIAEEVASRWERKEAMSSRWSCAGNWPGALIVSHLMVALLYGVLPTDLPTVAGPWTNNIAAEMKN
jgi:hypothetical protein